MKNYDLVIAGCGTGGAITGIIAARAGLDVVVLDSLPKKQIGNKICGNAISDDDVKRIKDLGISIGKGILLHKIVDQEIISPNRKSSLIVSNEAGYIIDRHALGQALVKELKESGAKLAPETHVHKPLVGNDAVIGVKTNRGKLHANITIDATGFTGVLRQRIPFKTDFPKKVGEHMWNCYREIIETNDKIYNPSRLKIWLNQEITNGGYIWYFPSGTRKMNIGVAVSGDQNPLWAYGTLPLDYELKSVESTGGGVIPIRRPLGAYVANGFMLVGDAACQVNTLNGAGIGNSMKGGIIAADVAIKHRSDPERENLWEYNHTFCSGYGAEHAQVYMIAHLIRSLSDRSLNFILARQIIEGEDITYGSKTFEQTLGWLERGRRIKRGILRPDIIYKVWKMRKYVRRIKRHYKAYPKNCLHYPRWKELEEDMFARAGEII